MLIDFLRKKLGTDDPARELAFWALLGVMAAVTFSISLFEIFVTALIILSLASFAARREWKVFANPFFLLAGLYFSMNLASLTQTGYWDASLRGMFKIGENILLCLSAFYAVNSEEKLRKVFQWLLIVAFVTNADALIQGITGFEPLRQRPMTAYSGETKRLTGPFSHANNFSAYLSFVVVVFLGVVHDGKRFFSRTRYSFFLLGFFIALFCLVGTYSRGAWLAVGVTFLLYAVVKRSRALILMVAILGVWGIFFSPPLVKNRIVTLFDFKGGSVSERRELWGESLRMVQKSPWLGLGVNTYAKNEPFYKAPDSRTDNQYAHNGYLQMMAETGWLGLLSFLGVVGYFLTATLSVFRKTNEIFLKTAGTALVFGILSFLIHSLTDTNLQSLLLVNTLWLAMGVAWSARELCRKSAASYS